jgi:hypothetical protein
MATYPAPAGRRNLYVQLPAPLVAHLDAQADYQGCSRNAYIRRLAVADRDAAKPAARLATYPADGEPVKPITFMMDAALVDHLDTQAARFGCFRTAYIRHLIARDIRRQGVG